MPQICPFFYLSHTAFLCSSYCSTWDSRAREITLLFTGVGGRWEKCRVALKDQIVGFAQSKEEGAANSFVKLFYFVSLAKEREMGVLRYIHRANFANDAIHSYRQASNWRFRYFPGLYFYPSFQAICPQTSFSFYPTRIANPKRLLKCLFLNLARRLCVTNRLGGDATRTCVICICCVRTHMYCPWIYMYTYKRASVTEYSCTVTEEHPHFRSRFSSLRLILRFLFVSNMLFIDSTPLTGSFSLVLFLRIQWSSMKKDAF